MACLREAGFSFKTSVHAYSALDSYIYGFALQGRPCRSRSPQEPAEVAETKLRMLPPSIAEEYPYLIEVVVELGKSGYSYAVEFEVGYAVEFEVGPDQLLDGIEHLRQE
jgi:Tetracyclin repressor-like, C-terminal domain